MLALATITVACGPSWPRERVANCGDAPQYREGYHRVVHRLASPVPNSSPDRLGGIVTLMTQANSRRTGVVREYGAVRLFRGGGGRAASDVLRHRFVDTTGRVVFDSLPSGWYYVEGAAIGFSRLGDSVHVRSGYRDSIELQMRTNPLCLHGVGVGAT